MEEYCCIEGCEKGKEYQIKWEKEGETIQERGACNQLAHVAQAGFDEERGKPSSITQMVTNEEDSHLLKIVTGTLPYQELVKTGEFKVRKE